MPPISAKLEKHGKGRQRCVAKNRAGALINADEIRTEAVAEHANGRAPIIARGDVDRYSRLESARTVVFARIYTPRRLIRRRWCARLGSVRLLQGCDRCKLIMYFE